MGFFRRYKLTDYTADECRVQIAKRAKMLIFNINEHNEPMKTSDFERIMEEWACYRELLARHEKQNQSVLDDKDIPAAGFGMEEF